MSYDLEQVPPSGDTSSRYRLTTSPTGVTVGAAENITNAYLQLVDRRQREAEPDGPVTEEIVLPRIARTTEGEYVAVPCPAIHLVPDSRRLTTGRFTKSDLRGGALLDDAFGGGPSLRETHDRELVEAARALAEEEGLRQTNLLRLNQALQLLLLVRRGVTAVKPWDLPILKAA
jgi:hypothetical protein